MINLKPQTSFTITLDKNDAVVINRLIQEETKYFNSLVNNFSGAARTMTTSMNEFTEHHEQLLGEVASSQINLRSIKFDNVPDNLVRFQNIMFDGSRFVIDDRKMIFFDATRAPGNIPAALRRKMAVAIFRAIREQVNAVASAQNTSINPEDNAYNTSIQTVTPHETYNKRHIQIPSNITKSVVVTRDGTKITNIYTPYSRNPICIEGAVPRWSLMILRKEDGDRFTVEFRMSSSYDVFKRDSVLRKRGRK